MENRAEYFEVCWAAQRSGLFYTCINSHFNAEEAAYILDDCDAQVLVISDTFARRRGRARSTRCPSVKVRLMVGDDAGRRLRLRTRRRVTAFPAEPLEEELEGTRMLYSSGTTGRPKGVRYKIPRQRVGDQPARDGDDDHGLAAWTSTRVYLSPAPLYHSAPLFYCMSTMRLGGTAIVMEQFDPEQALACIEKYRVTHSQWVPTMFVRMLKLPDDVRDALRPVVAEGRDPRGRAVLGRDQAQDDRVVGPDHRRVLRRDRRHGRDVHQQPPTGSRTRARSASRCSARSTSSTTKATSCPPGEVGTVWFEPPPNRPGFEYHKDEEKTRDSFNDEGWSTVGDMGYLDDDGYLFLTDRRTFMIVSGGVNIYPQEAENLLIDHPKVYDVAVFGIPDPEMGERVHGGRAADRLGRRRPRARTRAPRRTAVDTSRTTSARRPIDFDRELPREQTGKLYKRLLRDRYWGDKTSRIV